MAKNQQSILVAISQSISRDLTNVPPAQWQASATVTGGVPSMSTLLCSSGCHAYHSWLSNIINTMFFDLRRPSVMWWLIQWIYEAIVSRPKSREIWRCCRWWRKVRKCSSGKCWQGEPKVGYFISEERSKFVCESKVKRSTRTAL